MTATFVEPPQTLRAVRRFFLTPKGILLLILSFIAVIASVSAGPAEVAPVLLGAVAGAVIVDLISARIIRGAWFFPSGAVLTGLIVGLVLSTTEPWPIAVATSVFAIGSKHMLRTRTANVFNPAAVALVVSSILFQGAQSWWGALPDLGPIGVLVLLAAGAFIVDRINKFPLIVAFLATYFAAFTMASFLVEPGKVAEIFRTPDLQAALFFAFFMLDDPPTCPVRYGDQVVFGFVVALVSYLVFMVWGTVYFLPAGLLAGNACEAVRRTVVAHRRLRPATA